MEQVSLSTSIGARRIRRAPRAYKSVFRDPSLLPPHLRPEAQGSHVSVVCQEVSSKI